jgi:U8 snoRNA-decapping enzyme
MLHAPCEEVLFGRNPVRHAVMLQMRFDGMVGFPGGFVDGGEDLETGLNREMAEELGSDEKDIQLTVDHYLMSHHSHSLRLCLHFYSKRITYDHFVQLERNATSAKDHGLEVLGVIRCPVYVWREVLGLPAFLLHNFVGNAQHQLLYALEHEKILSSEEIKSAVQLSEILKRKKEMGEI